MQELYVYFFFHAITSEKWRPLMEDYAIESEIEQEYYGMKHKAIV